MNLHIIKNYLVTRLPNIISLLRIFIAFFLGIIFYKNNKIDSLFILLFLIAAVSDKLDGYLAKKLNCITDFGKLVDPIADKILIIMMLYIFYKNNLLPLWAMCICIVKDIFLSLYRYIKLSNGIVVSALKLGRYKTAYNLFVFGVVLFALLNINTIDNKQMHIIKILLVTTVL